MLGQLSSMIAQIEISKQKVPKFGATTLDPYCTVLWKAAFPTFSGCRWP